MLTMTDDKRGKDSLDRKENSPDVSPGVSGHIKRKNQPLNILDYFQKRRRIAEDDEIGELTMNQQARELMAAAAEQRLQRITPSREMPVFDSEMTAADSSNEVDAVLDDNDDGDAALLEYMDNEDQIAPKCVPERFTTIADYRMHLPRLSLQPNHTILFRLHPSADVPPTPYPNSYRDLWDKDHVRMPCSKENRYPDQHRKITGRWGLISNVLSKPFKTSKDFQAAVLHYNSHYRDKWNFEGWHVYCNQILSTSMRDDLLRNLLPAIARLAMKLPSLCTQAIPLLKRKSPMRLTLSQEQIACLLANAFFCTFPRRNSPKYSEYSCFPDINFNRLFRGYKDVVHDVKVEKIRCILHYFKRVTEEVPSGVVTFERKFLSDEDIPNWSRCHKLFSDLEVSSNGAIEDQGTGLLQVDFANRLIGGGVIGMGCVQEEIRFLICPEMIVARLFTERLDPNETLLMTGCERFSSHSGYAQTFKWTGDFVDQTPRDFWQRRHSEVIAMDACVFHSYQDQVKEDRLHRELTKALSGFLEKQSSTEHPPAVATGNWGCGAFGGDPRIKAMIQLMAAAVCQRDLLYFTFGDQGLADQLTDFHSFLRRHKIDVASIWRLLRLYESEIICTDVYIDLFHYLKKNLLRDSDKSSPVLSTASCQALEANSSPFDGATPPSVVATT